MWHARPELDGPLRRLDRVRHSPDGHELFRKMHLDAPIVRVDFRGLLEDLQGSEGIAGDEMVLGIVAHRAVRVQLSSDRNSAPGTLHRRRMSRWRTALAALGDPRSAAGKIVPGGCE